VTSPLVQKCALSPSERQIQVFLSCRWIGRCDFTACSEMCALTI